jgi:hypothetical protein
MAFHPAHQTFGQGANQRIRRPQLPTNRQGHRPVDIVGIEALQRALHRGFDIRRADRLDLLELRRDDL